MRLFASGILTAFTAPVLLPLAGVAAGGPAVGAALLVAGVVAGKQIDQIAEVNYSVKGSLDNPDVVRVARKKLFGGSQRQRLLQPFVDATPDSSNEKQNWRSESTPWISGMTRISWFTRRVPRSRSPET